MPLYEHVFVARQDLSGAQAEGLTEHFAAILSDNGGKMIDSEYWGVKTMAFKINKNRKGHYAFMRTDAPPDAVQEMERLMRLHEDVMRVMTIKVDAQEGPSVADAESATTATATVAASAARTSRGDNRWPQNRFSAAARSAPSRATTRRRSTTRTPAAAALHLRARQDRALPHHRRFVRRSSASWPGRSSAPGSSRCCPTA
jgi:small subunit ribosomal protein S6